MNETRVAIDSLLARLLRTESLVTLAGFGLYLTGRIESLEEAIAVTGVVAPLVLGRSYAKRSAE